ncbi:hypothetical protein DPMN_005934 [Dreissena polymorpha]|uniref:Uncharacterized protein n=1 Tax=Dreissena polymorpha TaxID=45954 RepID=A0A9D4MRA9_DREPO|nr:hypothetical protein DPMN_005934 [Dreissena polymorpha]
MAETALRTYLRQSKEKMRNTVHIMTRKTVQRASRDHLLVEKCIHNQLKAEMTQEDPDNQILLDHAKDLYSSLLRGKMMLADGMLCDLYQTRKGYRDEEET